MYCNSVDLTFPSESRRVREDTEQRGGMDEQDTAKAAEANLGPIPN